MHNHDNIHRHNIDNERTTYNNNSNTQTQRTSTQRNNKLTHKLIEKQATKKDSLPVSQVAETLSYFQRGLRTAISTPTC